MDYRTANLEELNLAMGATITERNVASPELAGVLEIQVQLIAEHGRARLCLEAAAEVRQKWLNAITEYAKGLEYFRRVDLCRMFLGLTWEESETIWLSEMRRRREEQT